MKTAEQWINLLRDAPSPAGESPEETVASMILADLALCDKPSRRRNLAAALEDGRGFTRT